MARVRVGSQVTLSVAQGKPEIYLEFSVKAHANLHPDPRGVQVATKSIAKIINQ